MELNRGHEPRSQLLGWSRPSCLTIPGCEGESFKAVLKWRVFVTGEWSSLIYETEAIEEEDQ
jgi:hypothetical protein